MENFKQLKELIASADKEAAAFSRTGTRQQGHVYAGCCNKSKFRQLLYVLGNI